MKVIFIFVFLLLVFGTGFSQNTQYGILGMYNFPTNQTAASELSLEVRARYARPIKKETLHKAVFLSDLSAGYPKAWVTDYISTEISTTCNGKATKAVGKNNTLTTEQRNILKTVDMGSDIVIDVLYEYQNAATNDTYLMSLHIIVTLAPEIDTEYVGADKQTEAEYIGGEQQMRAYFKQYAMDKISKTDAQKIEKGTVRFTVNEKGEIAHATLFKTSGNAKTDKLLLEAIYKMPKWKPAENSKGMKIHQEFDFSIGRFGC